MSPVRSIKLTCALVLAGAAFAELPARLPREGTLLSSASLGQGVEVGVYGPDPVTTEEPAAISVIISGSRSITITLGVVLMAWRHGAINVSDAPSPAGSYVPFEQWSPHLGIGWRQLLSASIRNFGDVSQLDKRAPEGTVPSDDADAHVRDASSKLRVDALNLDPEELWATPVAPMAPVTFEGGTEALLEAVLSSEAWARPRSGSPFRGLDPDEGMGVVFLADDTVRSRAEIASAYRGAHCVKLTFPLVFKDQQATLSFWIACLANGKPCTQAITASVAPRADVRHSPKPIDEPPRVDSPAEGAEIGNTVKVTGTTSKPGTLLVAWLEADEPLNSEKPPARSVVRHITDDTGAFSVTVAVPQEEAALIYELHVRTDAPGYQSLEVIRRLNYHP